MAPLINKQLIIFLENSTNAEGSTGQQSWCGEDADGLPACTTWMLALFVLSLYLTQLISGALRAYTEFQAKRMSMHSYACLLYTSPSPRDRG